MVLPLTASNFRHSETRMAAWMQLFLHKLMPTIRLRFFQKLRVLQSTVAGLAKQFKNPGNYHRYKIEAHHAKNHWTVWFFVDPPTPDGFEFVTICDCGRVLQ